MSGMSSILHILLYREAPSHHEPNERGNRRSGRYHPEKLFPSKSARCERIPGRPGWMPSMLLISLMQSTPPFWMPALRRLGAMTPAPERRLDAECANITRQTDRAGV